MPEPPETTSVYRCEFFSVPRPLHEAFQDAYPMLDIMQEYKKMRAWLLADPSRKKKRYSVFINGWLSRAARSWTSLTQINKMAAEIAHQHSIPKPPPNESWRNPEQEKQKLKGAGYKA